MVRRCSSSNVLSDRRIVSQQDSDVHQLVEAHGVSRELAAYVHDVLSRRSPLGASRKPTRVSCS